MKEVPQVTSYFHRLLPLPRLLSAHPSSPCAPCVSGLSMVGACTFESILFFFSFFSLLLSFLLFLLAKRLIDLICSPHQALLIYIIFLTYPSLFFFFLSFSSCTFLKYFLPFHTPNIHTYTYFPIYHTHFHPFPSHPPLSTSTRQLGSISWFTSHAKDSP
ncbi:hypothetical protein F4775DRAFT_100869 [Biscogniauxia sp. FL1348]|nr:hypothetical protein F4775DRAFT_100869 [Biscogniauxia sp. FL1348]